jgi:hypothetical protein
LRVAGGGRTFAPAAAGDETFSFGNALQRLKNQALTSPLILFIFQHTA